MAAAFVVLIALQIHAQTRDPATIRAVDYLAREVPRWSQENHCFSCHNNGDGARALYAAAGLGYRVPNSAVADTTRWLLEPAKWDSNRANPAFSDKKLARIQFAAALAQAFDAGAVRDRRALIEAAKSLLVFQDADGSWQVDIGAAAGSPVTYGAALATYMARRTLEKADASRFAEAIGRADHWFLQIKPRSMLDTAAALLASPDSGPVRQRSLDLIIPAQSSDGGWGPYPLSPAEPFDTAVVLLALHEVNESDRTSHAIARGREFLMAQQQPGGGWQETTRPPGARSYAQHISTSAWATLALLQTDARAARK